MCRVEMAEPIKLVNTLDRRARMEHRCGECGRTIRPGEHYEFVKGLGDMDQWVQYKTCPHCQGARVWLWRECRGFVYTEVLDELIEHWEECGSSRSLWLARVIAGMKHQWHAGRLPVPESPPVVAA